MRRRGHFGSQRTDNRLRVNERIRAPEVRVIDDEGGQVGILPIEQARRLAKEKDLDLVEISPTASPPVCKLMNFGKYMYQQSRG